MIISKEYKGNANTVFLLQLPRYKNIFLKMYKNKKSYEREKFALHYLKKYHIVPKALYAKYPYIFLQDLGKCISNNINKQIIIKIAERIAYLHLIKNDKYQITKSRQGSVASEILANQHIFPLILTPIHGDLTPYNIINSNNKISFIDLEEFGLGDPLIDISIFLIENDLIFTKYAEIFEKVYFANINIIKLFEHWGKHKFSYIDASLNSLKRWAKGADNKKLLIQYNVIENKLKGIC